MGRAKGTESCDAGGGKRGREMGKGRRQLVGLTENCCQVLQVFGQRKGYGCVTKSRRTVKGTICVSCCGVGGRVRVEEEGKREWRQGSVLEPMKVATNQFNSLANTTNCSEAKPECRQHTDTHIHKRTHTYTQRGNNASRTSLEPCTEADQSCTINWPGRPLIVKTKATATTKETRTITIKTTNK